MKPNRFFKIVLSLTLGFTLIGTCACADDSNPTPNAITGVVDVTQGAIKELEDELAQHVAQSKFNASDYKEWNAQFRAKLNQDLVNYEQNLATQVVQKLQPLADRYKEILADQSFREDQRQFLAQAEFTQLQQEAASLNATYQALYVNVIKDLMGFLPALKITSTGDNTRGVFGWGGHQSMFHYEISALDPTMGPSLSGDFGMADLQQQNFCRWFDSRGYPSACSPYSPTSPFLVLFQNDLSNYRYSDYGGKALSDYLAGNQDGRWDIVDNLISKAGQPDPIMTEFVSPAIEKGCTSQICLLLKSSDLMLTFSTLSQQLDQPFVVSFADQPSDANAQNSVTIPAATISSGTYSALLSQPVTDNSLPFDTAN